MHVPVDRDFVFPKWTNFIPFVLVLLALSGAAGAHVVFGVIANPRVYEAGYAPEQPVPYSHKLHAGDLGIDCKYCHFNSENSSVAAVPSTSICMKCHSSVKTDSPKLQALRRAHENDEALEWVRVHRLPDHVHFNHKAHVQVGIDCQHCHGPVERMDKMKVVAPLSMGWCLDCHRKVDGRGSQDNRREVLDAIEGLSGETNHPTLVKNRWEDVKDLHGRLFETGERSLDDLNPPVNCSGCHQ